MRLNYAPAGNIAKLLEDARLVSERGSVEFEERTNMLIIKVCILVVASRSFAAESKSPVADAAERQDSQRLQAQLEQRADVNAAQADGMTALHWTVQHDDASGVKTLIKAGANVKAANRYGVTPLSIACTNGSDAIVKLLLDGGADCNTTLPGGETALMTASRTGKVEPVKLLIRAGPTWMLRNTTARQRLCGLRLKGMSTW